MEQGVRDRRAAATRLKVRWIIFALLLLLTVAAYVQRTAVSVVARPIMPELGLSQLQIGWLEMAFLVSYTALQIPGSVLGQRLGVRAMVALCGGVSVAASAAFPLLPAVARGHALFALLAAAQLLLGAGQAPFFAMVSGAFECWFPRRQWALVQGLSAAGLGLGAAVSPAVIAALMVTVGWRAAILALGLPAALLVIAWWRMGRNDPAAHPWVTAVERAELAAEAGPPPRRAIDARTLGLLLRNKNVIALTLGYLLMNVVFYLITFWGFLYLVQARHFPDLQGGLIAAIPLLAGAAGAAAGGAVGSALYPRLGPRWGLRMVPLVALPGSAALLLAGIAAPGAGLAVAALAAAFACLETTESSFWAAAMEAGGENAVAASGILNTGGNLGGILATPVVAAMSGAGNWSGPFVLAAGCALGSAALWLLIDPTQPALNRP